LTTNQTFEHGGLMTIRVLIKNFKSNGFTDPKWIKRAKADVEAFYEDHEVVFISSDEEDNKLGSISAEAEHHNCQAVLWTELVKKDSLTSTKTFLGLGIHLCPISLIVAIQERGRYNRLKKLFVSWRSSGQIHH